MTQTEKYTTQMATLPDLSSSFALSDSRPIVEFVFRDLSGLAIVKEADKEVVKRISKPQLTYEYANELAADIYRMVNLVTARTHFDPEHINDVMLMVSEHVSDWMATVSIHHLVSARVWDTCLKLAKLDPSTAEEDKNKHMTYQTFWQSRHGINWTYEDPFTEEMLYVIKDEYNLRYETFGEDVILKKMWSSIIILIEGGINKSRNHLTLDHEKVIHKETFGQTTESAPTNNEGALGGFRRTVAKIFGDRK